MKKLFLLTLFIFLPIAGWGTSAPLAAQDIFHVSATINNPNTLLLVWKIKPGYFLYKDRIKLSTQENSIFNIGYVSYPEPEEKKFRQGQTDKVYRKELHLPVSVLASEPGESYLEVSFQGCADDGFCYPPEKTKLKLSFDSALSLSQITVEKQEVPEDENETLSEYDAFFTNNNFVLVILGFIGFGLLLSFTPCVLPMVPVLSGIIVGHGKDITTRKAFLLSLSYVLSMSLTYAIAGALVALMGSSLQVAMQSHWIISLFSLIFVLLALSMFGYYDLKLPLYWQNKLASITRSHAGGHYLGAALMGSLSTLILSPCVTAPLIGVLGYIAQTGNVVFGAITLFALGLGMGLPLLLIGLSAGKLLPKAGHWMNEVKSFFGVILLAMAIYLLGRILPAPLTMVLWGSLSVFLGIFLGALTRSLTNLQKFNQGLGIICLVYGVLILIGASQGNSNPLQPLASSGAQQTALAQTHYKVVTSLGDVKKALAGAEGKPIILDFYADWCSACKTIAATTLQDPDVVSALNNFVILKVDVTANDAQSRALLKHFNVVAPPTFLFINSSGKELVHLRTVGDVSAERFEESLKKTLASSS